VDVAKVLKDSWQAVQDSGVPKELQEVAFNRAIDLVAGPPKRPDPAGSPPPHQDPPSDGGAKGATGGNKSETDFYTTMGSAVGISVDALQKLIDINDGVPRIALKASQLPSVSSKAQKVVSLLLILARHYNNDENEVELSLCLAECKRLSCDDANFKRNVGQIPDLLLDGTGAETKAKVRAPLVKSAAETLRKLKVDLD
jgi:hypothetical protein